MKYVVFKTGNTFLPVIFPEHIAHSQVKCEDAVAVSAGFLSMTTGLVEMGRKSISLQLMPAPIDQALVAKALMDLGTASFLDMDAIDRMCNPAPNPDTRTCPPPIVARPRTRKPN